MLEGAIDVFAAEHAAPGRPRPPAPGGRHTHSPPGAPTVRGIIFDATDVLYDATLWRRRLLRLVHELGVASSYADFYRAWDRDYLVDVYRGRREYGEALEAFLLAAGLSWAQIDEVEAASRSGGQSGEVNLRPPWGIVKTLTELSDMGLLLAAWADAPHTAAQIAQRLGRLALAGRFHSVLSSCDVEAVQPSGECYRACLAALALPADDVLYVGQVPRHLAGAKAAGLATASFNAQPLAAVDMCLTRFEDLPAHVRSRPGRRSAA